MPSLKALGLRIVLSAPLLVAVAASSSAQFTGEPGHDQCVRVCRSVAVEAWKRLDDACNTPTGTMPSYCRCDDNPCVIAIAPGQARSHWSACPGGPGCDAVAKARDDCQQRCK